MAVKQPIIIPDASATPAAYRSALLALLGERDPLEILTATTEHIGELLQGRDRQALERRPSADEWSAAEIVGHLMDGEIVLAFRWRMIVTADRPAYPGYDEKRWATLPKPPVDSLVQAWQAVRGYNLWLLRAIPGEAWSRVGVHSEQGVETFEATVRALAGHDLAHLDQLERAHAT